MADIEVVKKSLLRRATDTLMDFGKLPPQARELEEAVLAAVMLDERAIHDIIELIKSPDVFYVDAHQRVWKAIAALHHGNSKIDLLTVTDQLKKNGDLENAGGYFFVAQLTNKISSAANIEEHTRIIMELYIKRCLIAISANTSKDAYDDTSDVMELVDRTCAEVEGLSTDLAGQGQKTFSDIVYDEATKLRTAGDSGKYITGVATYSKSLDAQLLGFQEENLIIIAGRPGMGKTSVAWHIAINQAKNGIPIGFFTLEMSDRELVHKMIAAQIGVDTKTVRKGGLKADEWARLDESIGEMAGYPICMYDRAALSITQLMAISRNWVRKQGVKAIYIDYIGKIRTTEKFGTREQQVSYISNHLKDMAKQLKIPVILLSQLSREVEKRGGDKRPILSDLRESGAVEQDADVVIFPYRPEYYGIERDKDGNAYPKGYTEIEIAKYRHGDPGTVRWIFEPQFSRFKDYREEQSYSQIQNNDEPF